MLMTIYIAEDIQMQMNCSYAIAMFNTHWYLKLFTNKVDLIRSDRRCTVCVCVCVCLIMVRCSSLPSPPSSARTVQCGNRRGRFSACRSFRGLTDCAAGRPAPGNRMRSFPGRTRHLIRIAIKAFI